ncbi:hypothetical protein KK083_07360 [Fulvivirgaceae bacterium PWU4]|uniref:Uncharacterized protein n=1 Tax=Chryseosolibacter histidini TaxID=2782349 RepID=A0AAP2GNA3_9BACT|nr:clostripain-related cysteine peptidase [Chryseosolibacter histidini]MBT1696685.1 hypothetical protein [Chryseosolibacter histidini]
MEKEWTVFYLIKAVDTDTMRPLVQMLRKLTTVVLPDNIAIVFCINFFKGNLEAILQTNPDLVIPDRDMKNFTTYFFELVNIGRTSAIKIIEERPGLLVTEPDDLQNFLVLKTLSKYQANRYLLFTWDHGNGFGIFSGATGPTEIIKSNVNVPVLTMEELSQALSRTMGERKIDLMIMMNCLMQVFNTGYTLRHNVEYLIAPQTLLGFEDYDYQKLFQKLVDDPGIPADALALYVIQCFTDNENTRGPFPVRLNMRAVSACNLNHFDKLGVLLAQLTVKLTHRLPTIFCELRRSFFQSQGVYLKPKLVDLFSLLNNLQTTEQDERQWIDEMLALEKQCVPRLFRGKGLPKSAPRLTYHGISISSPIEVPVARYSLIQKIMRFFPRQPQKDMLLTYEATDAWSTLVKQMESMESAGAAKNCP